MQIFYFQFENILSLKRNNVVTIKNIIHHFLNIMNKYNMDVVLYSFHMR